MLGIAVDRGRPFRDEDGRADAAPVAVVSAGFWQRHYGSATPDVGAPLVFDATPYTVIGGSWSDNKELVFVRELTSLYGADCRTFALGDTPSVHWTHETPLVLTPLSHAP